MNLSQNRPPNSALYIHMAAVNSWGARCWQSFVGIENREKGKELLHHTAGYLHQGKDAGIKLPGCMIFDNSIQNPYTHPT